MQSAHHVHLGDSELKRVTDRADNFFDGIFKSVRVALFGSKRTELAGEDTDIRVIDVTVVDVGCVIIIFPFANHVRNHPKCIKIVRLIQTESVRL